MSAVEVVAPVPFVTTIASDPVEEVLLLIESAAPVVAPLIETNTIVDTAVTKELVIVRVRSAAAAMLTVVKVTRPDLPLFTTGPEAAPDVDAAASKIPVPKAVATRFPLVAVMAPAVAVSVVDAVSEPVTAVLPVVLPIFTAPDPPVPIVVTAAPLVLMAEVPVAVIPPAVAIRPVEAVKEPDTAVLPVTLPKFSGPVPPVAIIVVAAPVALIEVAPTTVKAPKVVRPVTPSVPPINWLPETATLEKLTAPPPAGICVQLASPEAIETSIYACKPTLSSQT